MHMIKKDTLRVIKLNIYDLSSFCTMSSTRVMKLMLSKYDQTQFSRLFTKALSITTLKKLIYTIRMHRFKDLHVKLLEKV